MCATPVDSGHDFAFEYAGWAARTRFGSVTKTIDQFMWGFQHHFRSALTHRADTALKSIGVAAVPTALLVGFEEESGGHPICVEPERRGVEPGWFVGCRSAADAAYAGDLRARVFITDARSNEQFHMGLRDRCWAEAIRAVLDERAPGEPREWFVGRSGRVGRYRVFPVLSVLKARWDHLPRLTVQEDHHRFSMELSLQDAVIAQVLAGASRALVLSEEPVEPMGSDVDEDVTRGAKSFVRSLAFFKGSPMSGELFDSMNRVAAQPYEGRTGIGTLILAKEAETAYTLRLNAPIPLRETRAFRKALEMTDRDLHLLTDGRDATGLGRIDADYAREREAAFTLRVIGRGAWELAHCDVNLLRVTDGHPAIPEERLDRATFDDAVARIFGGAGDSSRLWDLAQAASGQAHGTMLVVHGDADVEATRLSPPAMHVEATLLSRDALLAASAIDGAILVDPLGRAHAAGVILDGHAVPGLGDPSRGARFNSAKRYLVENGHRCLIVVVSEDGMLNLLPELPRRVKRSYVEQALARMEQCTREDPTDFERFFEAERHVRALAFYLSEAQCARANDAREVIECAREALTDSEDGLGRVLRVGYEPFRPHEEMDASFFLDEDA